MIINMDTKLALVTGSSSGIGGSVVETLEAKGWEVIKPTHAELDLSNLDAVAAYAEDIKSIRKNINLIVHAAGVWHDNDKVFADMPMGTFRASQIIETINVGITAAVVLINGLLPIMNNGMFIGISGTFSDGAKGWLPYYTSKRALEDFMLGLSQDIAELRVYGISPADTATEAYKKFYPEYVASAQSPKTVSELVLSLVDGQEIYESGSVIELRQGVTSNTFHS